MKTTVPGADAQVLAGGLQSGVGEERSGLHYASSSWPQQTQDTAEPLSQHGGISGKPYLSKTKVRAGEGGSVPLHWSRQPHYNPWMSPSQSWWILPKQLWPMESPCQSRGNMRTKEQQREITAYGLTALSPSHSTA